MHDVQTRALREFMPCLTRIFWILGLQVFDDRLWENETCFPVHGSLPQISHLYAMRAKPPEVRWQDTSGMPVVDDGSGDYRGGTGDA
jgi:hypothetical protein